MRLRSLVQSFSLPHSFFLSPCLPPLSLSYIIACEHDVLRDDAFLYTDRLRQSQVSTTLKFYERAYHGILWLSKALPKSSLGLDMIGEMTDHVKKHL